MVLVVSCPTVPLQMRMTLDRNGQAAKKAPTTTSAQRPPEVQPFRFGGLYGVRCKGGRERFGSMAIDSSGALVGGRPAPKQ